MIFSTMHESESPAVDQVPVKNKYCLNRRNIQKYIQKKINVLWSVVCNE